MIKSHFTSPIVKIDNQEYHVDTGFGYYSSRAPLAIPEVFDAGREEMVFEQEGLKVQLRPDSECEFVYHGWIYEVWGPPKIEEEEEEEEEEEKGEMKKKRSGVVHFREDWANLEAYEWISKCAFNLGPIYEGDWTMANIHTATSNPFFQFIIS